MTSTIISTTDKNTMILRQLAASEPPSAWYSVIKALSLKMRNTRSSRSTRTSISTCRPGTNSARWVGKMESRSTMPKKLRALCQGWSRHSSRARYSSVKMAVNTISATVSARCSQAGKASTLSTTTSTLVRINKISTLSNYWPAGVSERNTTVCKRRRHVLGWATK